MTTPKEYAAALDRTRANEFNYLFMYGKFQFPETKQHWVQVKTDSNLLEQVLLLLI